MSVRKKAFIKAHILRWWIEERKRFIGAGICTTAFEHLIISLSYFRPTRMPLINVSNSFILFPSKLKFRQVRFLTPPPTAITLTWMNRTYIKLNEGWNYCSFALKFQVPKSKILVTHSIVSIHQYYKAVCTLVFMLSNQLLQDNLSKLGNRDWSWKWMCAGTIASSSNQ